MSIIHAVNNNNNNNKNVFVHRTFDIFIKRETEKLHYSCFHLFIFIGFSDLFRLTIFFKK